MNVPPKLKDLIIAKGREIGVDPLIFAAIIMQESAFDPYAIRFESHWKIYKDPETFARKQRISVETEKSMQAHSFGLTQCMGCVMRERGFDGPWALAFDPATNITCGMKHFKLFMGRHENLLDQIASYNAGSPRRTPVGTYVNQYYVDAVLRHRDALKGLF